MTAECPAQEELLVRKPAYVGIVYHIQPLVSFLILYVQSVVEKTSSEIVFVSV
jgi:hypothetical protein